jgi:hypothetical protein
LLSEEFLCAESNRHYRKYLLLSQSRKERQEIFCKHAIFQDILVKNFASLAASREMIISNDISGDF